jgi:hypothetical protein
MEHLYVLFHHRAGEVLQALYMAFQKATAPLDRQGDENVFRQQQGIYTSLLRHRLEGIALELISRVEPAANRNSCNLALSRFIQDYLFEFAQKIRSL